MEVFLKGLEEELRRIRGAHCPTHLNTHLHAGREVDENLRILDGTIDLLNSWSGLPKVPIKTIDRQ